MASPFSGGAGRRASIAQGTMVQQGRDQAYGFMDEGRDRSLGALGAGFGQARKDVASGTRGALGALGSAYRTAGDALRTGYGTADGYLGQASDLYDPLISTANAGYGAYADAAGVNGAEGYGRARTSFQTGPGYEFMRDEAVDSAARKANALGMTASGNTLDAITRVSSGLADQQWDDYVSRLNPYLTLAPQLTGAKANILSSRASLADNYGRGQADLATGFGRGRADLISGEGRTLADLSRGLGTGEAGIYTADATNRAGIATDTSRELGNILAGGMKAGDQAAANRFGAIMGGLQLGASVLGGASGGGGMLSSLGGLFGGGGGLTGNNWRTGDGSIPAGYTRYGPR